MFSNATVESYPQSDYDQAKGKWAPLKTEVLLTLRKADSGACVGWDVKRCESRRKRAGLPHVPAPDASRRFSLDEEAIYLSKR